MAVSPSTPSSTTRSPEPRASTSISLAPYSFRVRRRRESDYRAFKDPDYGDLYDTLLGCLKGLVAHHAVHEDEQQLITVRRLAAHPKQRWIEGWLEAGAYGWEADLRDVDTYDQHYHRLEDDVEVLPFYFLLRLPVHDTHGVLILERFGAHGVKTAFERELEHCLYEELILSVDPLVPEPYVEHLRQAERIRKVRLLRTEVPTNIAEAFDLGGVQDVSAELVIHIGNDATLPAKLRRLVFGGKRATGYAAVDQAFPHDRMKVEVEIDGKTRTLDVESPGRITAFHDVTDAVEQKGGHPAWQSIRTEAFRLLQEIRTSTYSLRGEWIRPAVGRSRDGTAVGGKPPKPTLEVEADDRESKTLRMTA